MKNLFDKYFERQEERTDIIVKNICEYIKKYYINWSYTTTDKNLTQHLRREQAIKLIVQYLEETDISITNAELHLIMTNIKIEYKF